MTITEKELNEARTAWGNGLIDISTPDPDLEINSITPSGEFLMVFNIDLAGPSFIQKLE